MLSPMRHKNLKPVLAVLSCLMMVSAFVTMMRIHARTNALNTPRHLRAQKHFQYPVGMHA